MLKLVHTGINDMSKELLRIVIYKDINKQHEVTLNGVKIYTINQNDLYEVIRETITARLEANHQAILEAMKKQGAIKIQ